jgi:hypothetical protein
MVHTRPRHWTLLNRLHSLTSYLFGVNIKNIHSSTFSSPKYFFPIINCFLNLVGIIALSKRSTFPAALTVGTAWLRKSQIHNFVRLNSVSIRCDNFCKDLRTGPQIIQKFLPILREPKDIYYWTKAYIFQIRAKSICNPLQPLKD